MGCGWSRGCCIALALLTLPRMLRADFVHVLPSGGSAANSGSIVPPNDSTSASPAGPVASPRHISTAPESPWVAPPDSRVDVAGISASEQIAATLAKVPPLQLPPDGAAKGVRPLVLNDAANPTVPEPSMFPLAALALSGLLARRRCDGLAPAGPA
jgi:uncharacterized protein (TIGR03382 family)